VATNTDATIPSPRGPLPGNGALVGVVAAVTGQAPLVTGKPDPAMHAECVRRTGATRPLVVGDRLDTDIEGARRAGAAGLLVLTGVTAPAALLAAGPDSRPDLLAPDAAGLLAVHPRVAGDGRSWRCGAWSAGPAEAPGLLVLRREASVPSDSGPDGTGPHDDGRSGTDGLDGLRALCVAAWSAFPDRPAAVRVVGDGEEAAAVVDRWRLPAA
jgi:hypothetical protein